MKSVGMCQAGLRSYRNVRCIILLVICLPIIMMALHNFVLTEQSYDTGAKERSGRNKMAGNKSSCPDVSAPDVSACDVSLLPVSDISSEFFCVYDDVMDIIINSTRKDLKFNIDHINTQTSHICGH